MATGPLQLLVIDDTISTPELDCDVVGADIPGFTAVPECIEAEIVIDLEPGVYYLWAGPAGGTTFDTVPCGTFEYVIEWSCEPAP